MRKHEIKSALFIAWRYFFSRKSTHAVNIIAVVAIIGISLVALSMVVVLSVFNGFEKFTTEQFSSLSPKYIIKRVDGKPFDLSLLNIEEGQGVLVEQGLASYKENASTIKVLGISDAYREVVPLNHYIFDGSFDVGSVEHPNAFVGLGVALELGTGVEYRTPLRITFPKRVGKVSMVMPTKNFNSQDFVITGTFKLDQPEDNEVVFLPIETVRLLLQYEAHEVSYLALGDKVTETRAETINKQLGEEYQMLDRYEQHPEVYRVLKVEKWVSFLLLFFVLILTLFSVISTLGMLVLEKQHDSLTLYFIGARSKMIDAVILIEGWLLSVTGLVLGLSLGVLLVFLQSKYKFAKFAGGESGAFIINAYPVALKVMDLFWIAVIILSIGWISSRIAYRLFRGPLDMGNQK